MSHPKRCQGRGLVRVRWSLRSNIQHRTWNMEHRTLKEHPCLLGSLPTTWVCDHGWTQHASGSDTAWRRPKESENDDEMRCPHQLPKLLPSERFTFCRPFLKNVPGSFDLAIRFGENGDRANHGRRGTLSQACFEAGPMATCDCG